MGHIHSKKATPMPFGTARATFLVLLKAKEALPINIHSPLYLKFLLNKRQEIDAIVSPTKRVAFIVGSTGIGKIFFLYISFIAAEVKW